MGNQLRAQAVIVEGVDYDPSIQSMMLSFYDSDGTALAITDADVSAIQSDITDLQDADTAMDTRVDALEAHVVSAVTTATAIGTAAKTTTTAEPAANTLVMVKFTNGNSAETPTLAFNGGTARVMKLGGTASAAAKLAVAANGVVGFWFDGTILHQLGEIV